MKEEHLKSKKRWDDYYYKIAKVVGENSKCYSRKVGVIVVRDKQIISTGYNGPASGVKHCEERNPNKEKECPRRLLGYGSGEGLSICRAAHGETNSLIQAAKFGISTNGATMYCDCNIPCNECAKLIINAGISEIVINDLIEYEGNGYPSLEMFREAGVKVRKFVK